MKKDNKGFSLVELIVVVAIMAVLMTVLAPQLLGYVEKTRLQKDNSAIAEIANAIKIAAADERINQEIADAGTITITADISTGTQVFDMAGGTATFTYATALTGTDRFLEDELQLVFPESVTAASNTYKDLANPATGTGTSVVIKVSMNSSNVVEVKVEGYMETTNSTATTTANAKEL